MGTPSTPAGSKAVSYRRDAVVRDIAGCMPTSSNQGGLTEDVVDLRSAVFMAFIRPLLAFMSVAAMS